MKFQFVARCAEQSVPLEVDLPYQPGKQGQRARRVAAGYLLAWLEADQAQIEASGDDQVTVSTSDGTWVIAEGGGVPDKRGVV